MKVSPEEYNSMLHLIRNPNEYFPFLRIPKDEPVYDIDLKTRTITVPEFLSVEKEHNAEIIWFKADRFYDDFDLYSCNCWILYSNVLKEDYFYAAPIMVIGEDFGVDKILIPWAIGESATRKGGTIEFSFQFFKLGTNDQGEKIFNFILNTRPAKGKVLPGIFADPRSVITEPAGENGSYTPEQAQLADMLSKLYDQYNKLNGEYNLYWIDATDD